MRLSPGNAQLAALFDNLIDLALIPSLGAGASPASASVDIRMQWHQFLDVMTSAAYLTAPDGGILYYNQAAVALWGHEPAADVSRWFGSCRLYRPDGRPMLPGESPMAVAVKERRAIVGAEVISERPDGTRVAFLAYPSPIWNDDGELIGALNVLVDISSRKRSELADQRLAAIVESSQDAIVSKDLNGVIDSWNAGAERLFAYTAEEVVGRHISILIPDDRADEETRIMQRIRQGQRVETFETVRQRKDGGLVDVAITVSPVRDGEGRIVGASKIARDISDQKRAAEFQRLLTGEMKHRIKNSLATVQAIARQTLTSVGPDEMSAFIGRLQALAGAHDVLTTGNLNRASLRQIVMQAIDVFDDIENNRFSIDGRDDAWIDADRASRLSMVLHELATNAIKYGALSNEIGHVAIEWEMRQTAEGRRLRLRWLEKNGPAVVKPERRGFGSTLIDRTFLSDESTVNLEYDPAGVHATFDFKL